MATVGPSSLALPPGGDGLRLGSLERVLAQHVGPMAKVLVRRASAGTVELAVVRQRVAAALVDVQARERFLAGTTQLVAAAEAPDAYEGVAPAPDPGATRQTTPLDANLLREGDVDKAAIALARSLGPVARVLARRCAQGAVTREQFVGCMLAQLSARIDATAVESELWRTLG